MYTDKKPWTSGPLTFIMPGQAGEYHKPTERWAAYVDQASSFGLGVYTPVATQLVAYRIGAENSTKRSDVSYMAPLVTANVLPDTEFSYEAYLAIGRVDEIRAWFAEIAARVQPQTEAGSYKRPILQRPLTAAGAAPATSAPLSLLLQPRAASGVKESSVSSHNAQLGGRSPVVTLPPAAVKVSVKAPAAAPKGKAPAAAPKGKAPAAAPKEKAPAAAPKAKATVAAKAPAAVPKNSPATPKNSTTALKQPPPAAPAAAQPTQPAAKAEPKTLLKDKSAGSKAGQSAAVAAVQTSGR
jgi:hypothetical protein